MDHVPALFISAAAWTVAAFVIAVLVDDIFGILLAVRTGSFDLQKLPSFLESQFGTKKAIALGGLILTAVLSGGDIKQAALAALTAGGGAITLAVVADIVAKMQALVSPGAKAGAAKAK